MYSDREGKLKALKIYKSILKELTETGQSNLSNSSTLLDVLYQLSLLCYDLQMLEDARTHCEDMIGMAPDNYQVCVNC